MTRTEVENLLFEAARNGTLLTDKHNPASLSAASNSPRSVISDELAPTLGPFILSRNYSIQEYENKTIPISPMYLVITPDSSSQFNVPASGVPAYSTVGGAPLDRIIVVSGSSQGIHVFGEHSGIILARERN